MNEFCPIMKDLCREDCAMYDEDGCLLIPSDNYEIAVEAVDKLDDIKQSLDFIGEHI